VPGHTDIPGNEEADRLAKAASLLPEPEAAQPTLAYLRRIARQKPEETFETWWATSAPEQYKRLNLKATTGCPPELSLPRAALHHLLVIPTYRSAKKKILHTKCTFLPPWETIIKIVKINLSLEFRSKLIFSFYFF
jgi:hypothetical protein